MPSYLIELAREARKNPTLAEAKLWNELRDRRLENSKFVRQKVVGRYRPDFYSHEAQLIIELDGSSHDTPEAQAYDLERTQNLEARGLRIIRFRNAQVMLEMPKVLSTIRQAIGKPLTPTPHPLVEGLHPNPDEQLPTTPSPRGEGGEERAG